MRQILLALPFLLGLSTALHAAEPFTVSSTSFGDGGDIPRTFAGTAAECGTGKGTSPQVSWQNPPEGTRSVAIFLFDPDGAKGLGVSHWVVYNVDVERNELAEGQAQVSGEGLSVGQNIAGDDDYRGPCPPKGERPHHYALTVIATDLEPGRLPEGLNRGAILKALKNHALAAQTVVGRYGH